MVRIPTPSRSAIALFDSPSAASRHASRLAAGEGRNVDQIRECGGTCVAARGNQPAGGAGCAFGS